MKLEIKQNILMEHLNYVIKGISNKNIIPVLNCIKFELTNEGLYLISTDNEIAIKTFIDKKNIENIDKCGELLVSGRFIYEIIRKLPNTLINIEEVIDNKIIITTSTSSFTLNCNNPDDFPSIDLDENNDPIYISKRVFTNIIKQTSFATSQQESRPVLTGINFKIEGNILECTATDSYRLSKKTIELKENVSENINIIIPTKNLIELTKLYATDDDDIELHIFSNKVIFKFNSIIMMSKLINGNFPDTSKLIPETFETSIKVNINEYFNAIDRASLLTSEEEKNIINLEILDNKMTISSNIPEIGNVEEKLLIENNSNNNLKIAFSSKYMMDAIKSFECSDIELLFNGEIKPIILKNPESDDLIQLIVPIRTY
jgi:DNA polymerase-3 subunit beta